HSDYGNQGMTLPLHPLCTLFPRLEGREFDTLVDDIRSNGLREPIITHEGMILDGGNRAAACAAAGVDPRYEQFAGGNLVTFVLSANLHRRHLSPGQAAAIVASAQDWANAQTVGNPQLRNVAQLDTAKDRAEISGASHRTQQSADKVAKADPELARRVAHGEVSLPAAVAQVENKPIKPPKPKLLSEEESARILADNAELRERMQEIASGAQEAIADNESMAKIFDADDRLCAALEEIKRLKAEVDSLKWQLNGAINKGNDAIRRLKSAMAKIEKLEKQAKAAGIAA
ncbi:MAG TPA: hypothetical protein PKI24_23950, partial [Nitrospira sp.]|nr:hypothetical protein [Nitrospira sp.]